MRRRNIEILENISLENIWDPNRSNELEKKADKRRVIVSKQKKYKNIKLTNKIKVIRQWRSGSNVEKD